MAETIKKCKVCGATMSSGVAVCPSCGAKIKKPIYKRWWFWVIVALGVFILIAAFSDSDEEIVQNNDVRNSVGSVQTNEVEIQYTNYSVSQIYNMMDENLISAKNKLINQNVEIIGYIGSIDNENCVIIYSEPNDEDSYWGNIYCYFNKNKKILEQLSKLSKGDPVVVRGKVTNVEQSTFLSQNNVDISVYSINAIK